MPSTWNSAHTGDVTCNCGRVYERTVDRLPTRDAGSFKCQCGHELESWNSTFSPNFELKQDIS